MANKIIQLSDIHTEFDPGKSAGSCSYQLRFSFDNSLQASVSFRLFTDAMDVAERLRELADALEGLHNGTVED